MKNIESRIVAIVARTMCRVDSTKVVPSASISDDLGADSLEKIEAIMALEDEFGLEIPDSDVENISTVQDAIDYVVQALSRTTSRSSLSQVSRK